MEMIWEALILGEDESQAGTAELTPGELRERAVRMVLEIHAREGRAHGEVAPDGPAVGIHREKLRLWVRQAQIDNGQRPGTTSEACAPLARRPAWPIQLADAWFVQTTGESSRHWAQDMAAGPGRSGHYRAGDLPAICGRLAGQAGTYGPIPLRPVD